MTAQTNGDGSPFRRATKSRARLRLALCGPAGSGKTLSALRLAAGIGGTVALIDTERGSASLYADRFRFDVMELNPPHKPTRYVAAIKAAHAYDVLIIDSLSHAWAGEGGILEEVDAVQARGGNKFAAWGPAGKDQNALINAILAFPGSIIVTMRSKQEYALETDARGKQKPVKLGMAPVQRDGVEYEMSIVLDVGMDHTAGVGLAGKDRTGLFVDVERHVLTEQDGERVRDWLLTTPEHVDGMSVAANSLPADEQAAALAANPQPRKEYCTQQQIDALRDIGNDLGLSNEQRVDILRKYKAKRPTHLTVENANEIMLELSRKRVAELLTALEFNLDDIRSECPSVVADVPGELDQDQANAALAVLRAAYERTLTGQP